MVSFGSLFLRVDALIIIFFFSCLNYNRNVGLYFNRLLYGGLRILERFRVEGVCNIILLKNALSARNRCWPKAIPVYNVKR